MKATGWIVVVARFGLAIPVRDRARAVRIGQIMANKLHTRVTVKPAKVRATKARRRGKAERQVTRHSRPRQGRRTTAGARRRRRNPAAAPALERQARATAQMWLKREPKPEDLVRVNGQPLVKLGELRTIAYDSNKWTGRKETYKHTTKKPRPLLCTDAAGKKLLIVGGNVKVRGVGLVD